MSYAAIIEGLAERFAAVSGLSASQVFDYEPKAISPEPGAPVMYMLLDSATRSQAGQIARMEYRVLCRLCFLWQDNEQAEQELIPFINTVPASVDASPTLGGRLSGNGAGYLGGVARIEGARGVFVRINSTTYRALDFTAFIFEKFQYQSAGL